MSKQESKTEKNDETLYIAFDVEAKGDRITDPIIEIGVAWGTSAKNIQKMPLCLDYKNVPFQERCYNEFWSKQTDNLKRIETAAKNPKEQLTLLMKTMDSFEEKYANIKLVSDNPAYDIAKIDYALFTVLQRFLGVRYDSKGNYRSISDPSEQIKGLPIKTRNAIVVSVEKVQPHTHEAADDAAGILLTYFYVLQARANQDKFCTILGLRTENFHMSDDWA
jgi:hypothetical protein